MTQKSNTCKHPPTCHLLIRRLLKSSFKAAPLHSRTYYPGRNGLVIFLHSYSIQSNIDGKPTVYSGEERIMMLPLSSYSLLSLQCLAHGRCSKERKEGRKQNNWRERRAMVSEKIFLLRTTELRAERDVEVQLL